jgi:hypothetical protein
MMARSFQRISNEGPLKQAQTCSPYPDLNGENIWDDIVRDGRLNTA